MPTPSLHERAETFRSLHRPGHPFVLPNAWDLASAAALARAGFPAIGTTSLGVASAAGRPDASGCTRSETLALAQGMARLDAPVTVDVESGFGGGASGAAGLAAHLASLGIAGVNIEDGRGGAALAPADEQCALIRAMKDAAPALFVNARIDTYWLSRHLFRPGSGAERASATLERARAYRDAGADGVFVPGLEDTAVMADLAERVGLPLNVLAPRSPDGIAPLARAGVARVSTGSLLFRAALHSAVRTAVATAGGRGADGGQAASGIPGYDDVESLATLYRDADG
ncbi:isocitrate lyase/PEP mutase family protein [Nocardiopsis halophila]|uniref:isocitrate lyase/PEP mutase family protein n=1 Tax=Nocardiopsis halophila TaxID=141692 RepID=UPI0003482C0E|nr:isocitrate lyase/phosphoenolpyruvate mutase family protein [Nocardiopsis halophila]